MGQPASLANLRAGVDTLRRSRHLPPAQVLELVGQTGAMALTLLQARCDAHPIAWKGQGAKAYSVYSFEGAPTPFSRATNDALFDPDPDTFRANWNSVAAAILDAREVGPVDADPEAIDRAFYTAVVSFAAYMDLAQSGGAGALFEHMIRPVLRVLTGRDDAGQVKIPVPGQAKQDLIPVDMSFPSPGEGVSLVVASKITTRERIVQAFIHQLFLERLRPGGYRSVLVICSENNVGFPKSTTAPNRKPENGWVQDTLVPGTIAKYQRYVAELSGLYYLDPPASYLTGARPGLPPVRRFSSLLGGDLAQLLA